MQSEPGNPEPADVAALTRADAGLTDADRRAAIAKLGRLAALTAPGVMTLLLSPRASAESVTKDCGGFNQEPCPPTQE